MGVAGSVVSPPELPPLCCLARLGLVMMAQGLCEAEVDEAVRDEARKAIAQTAPGQAPHLSLLPLAVASAVG